MIVGIVGSEGKKFTPETEEKAREIIRGLLQGATGMTSGHCHLGGIDIFAEEEADKLGIEKFIYPPKTLNWEGGYRQRNIQIAKKSDECYCITIDKLPTTYSGMRFSMCYHCGTKDHVKSGGCWTTKYARLLGKKGETIVIQT